MDGKYFILYISFLSPLVPLFAGWGKKSLLWWYILFGLVTDLFSYALKDRGADIVWVANLFFLGEFVFISLFYQKEVFGKMVSFKFLSLLAGCLFAGQVLWSGITKLNAYGSAMFFVVYMAYSVGGFYKMLRQQKIVYLEESGLFWVHVSILLYATGNILIFLFNDYLLHNNRALLAEMWVYLHNGLTILCNLLFAVAFYKTRKT